MPEKRGLGKVVHAGREMVWAKGAVAGGFVFLSGAEARADDTDEPVEGVAAQTELALDRVEARLEEAGEERSYASTLLVVGLAKPEMLVEIDCIACVDSRG